MKISLIFAPYELNTNNEDLAFRDDGIGVIPPLSLLTVAAILEQEGVEVQLIDQQAENLSYNTLLERINRFGPDLLGFTLTTYSFHPVLKWIKRLRKDTGVRVLVGGAHVALYPEETMFHKEIDFAVVGEAEIPLPQLIRALIRGESLSGLKSICYRTPDGTPIIERTRQTMKELDRIPFPARHLIKNELYSNILTRKKNFTVIMSTRGCPYRCTFCDQKTPPYRWRSPESFIEEVRLNREKFDIQEFDIYDSTFTANRKRVMKICELLVAEGLKVNWTARSTLMAVNHEMLDAMKAAGCHTIMYGVESSNAEILKTMKKSIPRERVVDRIQYTHDIGIQVLGFFMFGYPGETRETIEDTIRYSLELPLDYAQYTVIWPFPDTEIHDLYQQQGDLGDYWARYTLDPEYNHKIDLVGTSLSRDEVSKYVGQAYRRFYFRPKMIWRRLSRVRSLGEFHRASRAGFGIIANSLKQTFSSDNS
nr:Radical SAM domain protein [uncultured bacterium]